MILKPRLATYDQPIHAACRHDDAFLAGHDIHSPRCHCDHSCNIYTCHPQHHGRRRPKQPVNPGVLVTRTGFRVINSTRHCRQRFALPRTCRRQRDLHYCSCSIRWRDTLCSRETVCITSSLSYSCRPQKQCRSGTLLI